MRWSQVVANPYQLRSMTSISNLRIIHEVTVSLKINNFKVHPSVLFIYFSTARFTFPLHTIYSIFPPSPPRKGFSLPRGCWGRWRIFLTHSDSKERRKKRT